MLDVFNHGLPDLSCPLPEQSTSNLGPALSSVVVCCMVYFSYGWKDRSGHHPARSLRGSSRREDHNKHECRCPRCLWRSLSTVPPSTLCFWCAHRNETHHVSQLQQQSVSRSSVFPSLFSFSVGSSTRCGWHSAQVDDMLNPSETGSSFLGGTIYCCKQTRWLTVWMIRFFFIRCS